MPPSGRRQSRPAWLTKRQSRKFATGPFVFALLQTAAQDVWQLTACRFCIGFAIGVDMQTGSSMLAEVSPPKLRGALTAMLNTAWLLGGCIATVVGYVLYQTTGPSAWRWMFAAAVPAAVIAVMRHGLPETPYWAREKQARSATGGRRPGGFAAVLGSRWRRPVAFFTAYWMLESFAGGPAFIYTALIFQRSSSSRAPLHCCSTPPCSPSTRS